MHVSLTLSNLFIILGVYKYNESIDLLSDVEKKYEVDKLNESARRAMHMAKVSIMLILVGTVVCLIATGLFVTKYWLMT